jgi:hypothetical protein
MLLLAIYLSNLENWTDAFGLGKSVSTYLLDVLWGQPIKLAQVASTSELLENQLNDLVFFKIIHSHFCRASEASKIDCFKN